MALTLRLEDQEIQQLERIKEQIGVATASAAIRHMIASYEQTQQRLANLLQAFHQEQDEAGRLKTQMLTFFQTQEALARMVGHTPNATTLAAINTPDAEMLCYNTFSDFLQEVDNADA